MTFNGFVGPAYVGRATRADGSRMVNLYLEKNADSFVLQGTPGLTAWKSGLDGVIRGIWVGEGRLFVASGQYVYELDANGNVVSPSPWTIGAGTTPVEIYPNGNQLLVAVGGAIKVLTGTDVVTPTFQNGTGIVDVSGTAVTWQSGDKFDPTMVGNSIALAGSPAGTVAAYVDDTHLTLSSSGGTLSDVTYACTYPVTGSHACFLDGYFIVVIPSTKRIHISAINDGQIWDGADYAFKEGYPDNLVRILADHEELWLFGSQTTEVWRNTGNADFPFERDPGAFIHQGCIAPWSVVRLSSGPAWLGSDYRGGPIAFRAQGYVPQRLSTESIESTWAAYTTVSDVEAFAYRDSGHEFWVLQFPTADKTWVYDLATDSWHERDYGGAGRWRGRCHGFAFGKHLVGDHGTGAIHRLVPTSGLDNGVTIQRVRRAPHLRDEMKRVAYSELAIDSDAGATASVTLRWSNDGGTNWNNPVTGSARIANGYPSRVIGHVWRRLGSSRDRVFELAISGIGNMAILNAHLQASSE